MMVSVIIPTYRPGVYIRECLGSLEAQTLPKDRFEVIVVLNGCDTPWSNEIREWMAGHPGLNVRLTQTDTAGVSNARNIGMDLAAGEYIAFIDDDDYVSPRYLEALLEGAGPGRAVISDILAFEEGTEGYDENYPLHKIYLEAHRGERKKDFLGMRSAFNGPWMKLLPADVVRRHRFDTSFRNGEDSLFMFEISEGISEIRTASPEAVYYRRFREGSATKTRRSPGARLSHSARLMTAYTRRWLRRPGEYSLPFYLSRLAATVKGHLLN